MKRVVASFLIAALAAEPAFAANVVTTANVNFRQGPGTQFGSFGTVPAGTSGELKECDDAGAWCSVVLNGKAGFVAGNYLQLSEPEKETGWPRSFETGSGATLILYQPQFSDWENFTQLSALVAAEYLKKGESNPVFGVIGLSGKTAQDGDTGNVIISDITVTELNFSALDRTAMTDLTLEVGKILPTGTLSVAEDRITAGLAEFKRMDDVKGLISEAPPIFISEEPAVLLQTDGEAILAPVKGGKDVQFVVNTNWDLLKDDASGAFYLRDEKSWMTSNSLASGWTAVSSLPPSLSSLPADDENWKETREAMPPEAFADGAAPKVIYSDVPAEMIVFEGKPELEAVPGTGLQWASNTDSDVFYLAETKAWYILVSGRWFRSAELQGPWEFATPDLPDDFLSIPEDAPYYSVRASVPNTSEAAQARLKASIPTTARVKVGSVAADVAYAGDPEFQAIEGTSLSYAVNTNDQVIKVGDQYFVLQDGIWFVGSSPTGPFQVATSVPDEIYTIPPSSPVYNATYVRIYDSEPDSVWYGYTMGYLTGFLSWGVYVYGTGWYNRPWYRPGPFPIYFPRPVSYGIGAFYNPVRGTFGRYGYAYGPLRGIAGGGIYNPRTGGYIRGAAISGPLGKAGFIAGYNPRTGNHFIAGGGRGIYGNWKGGGVVGGGEWARTRDVKASAIAKWSEGGKRPIPGLNRRGEVFGGRDGSVYRRQGDKWQKFEGGKWSHVQKPTEGALQDRLGELGGAAAAGGALGGAGLGAVLANRPAGDRPALNRPGGGLGNKPGGLVKPSIDRPQVTRPGANKPSTNRPQVNRPAGNRPNITKPGANRPSVNRPQTRPATRPAARPQAPAHLGRDVRARQVGNRQVSRQRMSRQAPRQHVGGRGGGGHRGGGGARMRRR